MLKKLILSAAIAGLTANPVLAAPQQAPVAPAVQEVAPDSETIGGQSFWGSGSPILIFLALVGVGVAIALLVDTDDEPASP